MAALELKNVAYGTDSLQRMDVSLPAGRSSATTKAFILIHGGAWVSGDKAEMNGAIEAFKTLLPDYAFFNLNYRLANSGGNLWPTQQDDIRAAVNFISSKAEEYQFNKTKMAIGGASAGAHLALLQAYRFNNGNLKAVADLFGPTDIKDLYLNSTTSTQFVLSLFMGGTPATNPQGYHDASPLFATQQSVPTIILHGTMDHVVPVHQSDSLHNRLLQGGTAVQYQKYSGEGHGIWSAASSADAYAKVAAFLKLHVK